MDYNWRVNIQKGVTHNFSKIVFLAKQILEVNANTIAQTIFFFNRKYFYFRFGNQKSVSRGVEIGTFLCRRVKFQKCGLRPFECPLFNFRILKDKSVELIKSSIIWEYWYYYILIKGLITLRIHKLLIKYNNLNYPHRNFTEELRNLWKQSCVYYSQIHIKNTTTRCLWISSLEKLC